MKYYNVELDTKGYFPIKDWCFKIRFCISGERASTSTFGQNLII